MRITSMNLKKMPDGAKFKVFLSGGHWDDEFGKVQEVIKLGNRLYNVGDFFDIDDMDKFDGYEFEVALNEYENSNKLFLSNSQP